MIHISVHVNDIKMIRQQPDERQEQLPVQPARVQVVGMEVRGRDDGHSGLEELLEQSSDNHGIGNVGDLHFIQAEELRRGGDPVCDRLEYGFAPRPSPLVQGFLNLLHERMEMDAPLRHWTRCLEKQVHQHRFTGPDSTV